MIVAKILLNSMREVKTYKIQCAKLLILKFQITVNKNRTLHSEKANDRIAQLAKFP